MSKFNDNLTFRLEVTEVLVKQQWLDKRYRDSAPGNSTIIYWYIEFKRDRTNIDDAKRSSRPKSAVVPENITKVHKISGDRKLKLRKIADTLKISEGSSLQFITNLWGCVSCFRSGCRVCSHPTKNNNASRIQSGFWSCLTF